MPLKITQGSGSNGQKDFTDHLVPDKEAQPAMGSVMMTKKGPDSTTEVITKAEQEVVSAPQIANKGEGFSITVGGGRTIPTEPYANVKLLVSITCPATKDTLDEVYEFASDWVSKKIDEAMGGM